MATEFARNYIVYTGTLQRGRRWLLNRGILSLHKRFRVMVRPAGDRPYPQRKLLVLDKRKLHRDGLPFFGAITDVGLVFHVSTPHASLLTRKAILEKCILEIPFSLASQLTHRVFIRGAKIAHALKK